MTHVFKHPKYYKELRKAGNELAKRNAVKEDLACSGSSPARNKSNQAISYDDSTESQGVRPGSGHKQQATSKQEGASNQQSTSSKAQATSLKP